MVGQESTAAQAAHRRYDRARFESSKKMGVGTFAKPHLIKDLYQNPPSCRRGKAVSSLTIDLSIQRRRRLCGALGQVRLSCQDAQTTGSWFILDTTSCATYTWSVTQAPKLAVKGQSSLPSSHQEN